jgi:hypothetical protein
LKAFGKIEKGKLVFDDKAKFLNELNNFTEGTRIIIRVEEAKDVRTNQQNKLYWTWVNILSSNIGYTKEETHNLVKYKFLLREEVIEGESNFYLKSTTTLSKSEFSKLTDDILFWANDTFNINLPNE